MDFFELLRGRIALDMEGASFRSQASRANRCCTKSEGPRLLRREILAEDLARGDSDGIYYAKAELLQLMGDPKKFKTNSEKLSALKVRV